MSGGGGVDNTHGRKISKPNVVRVNYSRTNGSRRIVRGRLREPTRPTANSYWQTGFSPTACVVCRNARRPMFGPCVRHSPKSLNMYDAFPKTIVYHSVAALAVEICCPTDKSPIQGAGSAYRYRATRPSRPPDRRANVLCATSVEKEVGKNVSSLRPAAVRIKPVINY